MGCIGFGHGATIRDVEKLERILKRSIILRHITEEKIFDSGKYQHRKNVGGGRGKLEVCLLYTSPSPRDA